MQVFRLKALVLACLSVTLPNPTWANDAQTDSTSSSNQNSKTLRRLNKVIVTGERDIAQRAEQAGCTTAAGCLRDTPQVLQSHAPNSAGSHCMAP